MDYAATILSKIPGTSSKLDRGLKHLIETLESYMPADQLAYPAIRSYLTHWR
jgi:hypothetical protein